ncbi:DNA-binding domain-containing protein [Treponema denticola]|uniref:DNA-binding domain-containing protein n=1 Tax=Treponema denticola TaxID=158 RepID=UPI0011CC6483|nr:DNA-binding domain-containing protein [Treponema denticola]
MLKYSLRENLLTPAPDDYMAQVADVRSYTLDEIIDLMMDKGTTLTRADVAATLQVYGEVCSSLIKDGAALNTPLMNTALSISGVFNGANDSFDKKRHTVNLNLTAGTLLRDAVTKVKCEKTEAASTDPYITEVADIVSGKVNEVLTKGGVVQLTGSRLKFKADDAAQGIFFVPETGNTARAAVIAENKPARVMAIIPADLPAGTYYIEVRTKLAEGGKALKNLKTGRFAKALTVTA